MSADQPLEDISEFFRLYEWKAGRVLSEPDIADLQQVLADYNDEIGKAADAYQIAREQVLREIGGEELVKAAAEAGEWEHSVILARALEHFHRKSAEYRDKARAAPAA